MELSSSVCSPLSGPAVEAQWSPLSLPTFLLLYRGGHFFQFRARPGKKFRSEARHREIRAGEDPNIWDLWDHKLSSASQLENCPWDHHSNVCNFGSQLFVYILILQAFSFQYSNKLNFGFTLRATLHCNPNTGSQSSPTSTWDWREYRSWSAWFLCLQGARQQWGRHIALLVKIAFHV